MTRSADIAALYDRWSPSYDEDANRTRDLAGVVLRRELDGGTIGNVVELGCGTGLNTAWLAGRARSVVALDFSAGMLDRARERVPAGARFVLHDIRTPLPLASGSADLLVITLVLEHVEALEPVLAECARVLRPGGRLFACELHPHRQREGGQAQFSEQAAGRRIRVPAYLHERVEYVNAAVAAELRVGGAGEWRDEADAAEGRPPRLVSFLFERS